MPNAVNKIERNIAEDNIIKDIRYLYKTKKKKSNDNDIEYKGLRDIRFLYEPDEQDYYEPIRIGNAFSNICIEYESNGDKYKILSTEKYLDKIRPYLGKIINDHKTQGEWKIQLTIAINFFFLKVVMKFVLYILRGIT